MVKYEKMTKENSADILANLYKEYGSNGYSSRHDNEKVLKQYYDELCRIDMNIPSADFLAAKVLRLEDPTKEGIESKFVLYKEHSRYNCFFYFSTKDGTRYANLEEAVTAHPNTTILPPEGYKFSHFKYCKELDLLLARSYNINSNYKTNSVNIVPDTNIFVIDRNKQFYNIDPSSYWSMIQKTTGWNSLPIVNIHGKNKTNLGVEFKKMFNRNIFNMGANKFICVEYPAALEQFGKYKAKLEIKNGPIQRKINELVAKPLPDVKITVPKKFTSTNFQPYSKTVVQKVEDGLCVIRWILKSPISGDTLDGFRIYIEGKEIYACKTDNKGSFIRTSISNIGIENFLSCDMAKVNKNDLKGTILEYYGEIINDIPAKGRSLLLLSFIQDPRLEQIFKIGLGPIACRAIEQNSCYVKQLFEQTMNISSSTRSEKNIYKYLGINKYQISKIIELLKTNKNAGVYAAKMMKAIYGDSSNDIDNKTTDEFFDALSKITARDHTISQAADRIRNIRKIVAEKNDNNLSKNLEKVSLKLMSANEVNLSYYRDYVSMVRYMNDFKNFKLNFDAQGDIKEMHDAATKVYNLKRYKDKAEKFQEQLVKVKKFEYQNKEDEFCVVIPTEPGDLANEGMALHHCVGSYIDRVSNGTTNIVFIRRKSDPTKPFFTVEISNDKVIEQVHGFSNKNADTEPNLPEFIERWAKNKHLKINGINKVR